MLGNKRFFSQSTNADSDSDKDKKPQEVDAEVPNYITYSVVDNLSCYLMKSDCGQNNNKYYVLQLLKNSSNQYYLHTRYGRVGNVQANTMDLTNEEKGRKDYQKIFKQKTGSSKGYTPIEMKLGKADNSVEVKLEKK